MSTIVTREAPDFTAIAVMPDGSFDERFTLSSLRGRYVILFFYPADFTFVCPSEILAFDDSLEEFRRRNTELVGVSVDSAVTHRAWRETPVAEGGIGPIRYPLIADDSKSIAERYGVLIEDGVALRGLFLIDRKGIVRHSVVNDLSLGRSVEEATRMVDALQFHESRGHVCPANWKKGDAGMKPDARGVVDYLSRYARSKAG